MTAQSLFSNRLERYAMKRKVADGLSGNFRGVCPILNRATVIPNTVCAYASCDGGIIPLWHGCVNAVCAVSESENRDADFGIFYRSGRKHTAGCKRVLQIAFPKA